LSLNVPRGPHTDSFDFELGLCETDFVQQIIWILLFRIVEAADFIDRRFVVIGLGAIASSERVNKGKHLKRPP